MLFWWIPASTIITTLSLVVPIVIISRLPSNFFVGDNGLAPLFIFGLGLVVLTTPSLAVAQAFALRYLQDTTSLTIVGRWIASTIVGVLFAFVVVLAINIAFLWSGSVILFGLVLGYVQSRMLRSYVEHAVWWLLTCAVASNLALLAGWVTTRIYPIDKDSDIPLYPLRSITYLGTLSLVMMFVFSTVTGFVLVWLFKKHVRQQDVKV